MQGFPFTSYPISCARLIECRPNLSISEDLVNVKSLRIIYLPVPANRYEAQGIPVTALTAVAAVAPQ